MSPSQPPERSDRFADPDGRYRLDSRIATGGMGEVWRATDLVLDRPVAVKILKGEYADDLTFRQRFETEARHAGSLHHRGIASVFDFGEGRADDGGAPRPFLVMELVDGRPLSDLLRPRSPMDPDAARALLAQAADAIAVAHRAGIVHRDVKPANLMVTPDRQVKITDFGIARAADGLALTQTGQVMGTPAYISPEQARGETATEASDIYALGVVLFECLAGHRPFQGETPVTTALAHVRDPVPDLPAAVPADLAAVVTRALAKDPADRFASASDFATALRDPSSRVTTRVRRPPTPAAPPVVADPVTQVIPVAGAIPSPAGPRPPAQPVRRGVPAWVWIVLAVGVLLAAGALAVALTSGDGSPSVAPTGTPSTSAPSTAPTAPSSSTTSITVDEDDYLGRDVDDVDTELTELGLRVTRSEQDNPGGETPGAVTDVSPTGALDEGDRVTVEFWGPEPETESPTPSETPSPSPTPSETPTESPSASQTPTGDQSDTQSAGEPVPADPAADPAADPTSQAGDQTGGQTAPDAEAGVDPDPAGTTDDGQDPS